MQQWKVGGCGKQHRPYELTIDQRQPDRLHPFHKPEKFPAHLQMGRSSELLKNLGGAQCLRPRLFKPVLLVPNRNLQRHRNTQIE